MNLKILFLVYFAFLNIIIYSQWHPDSRVTNDPAASFCTYNNASCLGESSGITHLVFEDNRRGLNEIYYKRSSDGCETWGPDIRITDTTSPAVTAPVLSVSGQNLHVSWVSGSWPNYNIYYIRSTDNGLSWSASQKLTKITSYYFYPTITVSGQYVHVAFQEQDSQYVYIHYIRSSDGGMSWGPDLTLINSYVSQAPCITNEGNNLHMVWYGAFSQNQLPCKIFYRRSTNNGETWSNDTMISSGTIDSWNPSISASGSRLNVAFEGHINVNGNTEVYYTYSSDRGLTWQPEMRLTNDVALSENPSVTGSGLNVHIAWWESRDGNYEIYYKNSLDGGLSWFSDMRLTNNTALSENPTAYNYGNDLYIVWYDRRDGNYEVYCKKNPNANMVGINNMNSNTAYEFKLLQNYPNPFNPSTKIRFSVPKQAEISINLSDITGKIISSIFQPKQFAAGVYETDFDGSNLSSGIYFYSLYADGLKIDTKKMVLVK